MKYCSKCGAELMDEAVICPKCGCAVGENRPANTTTTASSTNGFAIAGFVLAFFFPLLGIIFGAMGISKANKMGGSGKGLAIAAVIISSIATVISFIVFATSFTAIMAYIANEIR